MELLHHALCGHPWHTTGLYNSEAEYNMSANMEILQIIVPIWKYCKELNSYSNILEYVLMQNDYIYKCISVTLI